MLYTATKYLYLSIIVTCLLLITTRSYSANYFVDINASGSNTGTSWDDAWENMDNIVWASVNPGDTIWISGGTYNKALTVSKSGESGNYINVRPGAAHPTLSSGHDGIVIITGADYGISVSGTTSYINIDGSVNGYGQYIKVSGCLESGVSLSGDGIGVKILSLSIDNNGDSTGSEWLQNGILVNGWSGTGTSRRLEIANCIIDNNYYDQVHILGGYSIASYDVGLLHDNEISNLHDDGIELGMVSGWSIYNNRIHQKASTGASGHPDGIATNGASYLKVYNNICYDVVNSSICTSSCYLISGQTTSAVAPVDHVKVYNNLAYDNNTDILSCEGYGHPARGMEITMGPNSNSTSMSDWEVYNNTIIGFPIHGLSILPGNHPPSVQMKVYNNLLKNNGRNSKYSVLFGSTTTTASIGNYGSGANIEFDYNGIDVSGYTSVVYLGSLKTLSELINVNNINIHPTSNGVNFNIGNDGRLLSGNDVGIEFSGISNVDISGNNRKSGCCVDIGSYEYLYHYQRQSSGAISGGAIQ